MIKLYEKLTAFLPKLRRCTPGRIIMNGGHDPFVAYDAVMLDLFCVLYEMKHHDPVFDKDRYRRILAAENIKWNDRDSLTHVFLGCIDASECVALLIALTDMERICPGLMLGLCETGYICECLYRMHETRNASRLPDRVRRPQLSDGIRKMVLENPAEGQEVVFTENQAAISCGGDTEQYNLSKFIFRGIVDDLTQVYYEAPLCYRTVGDWRLYLIDREGRRFKVDGDYSQEGTTGEVSDAYRLLFGRQDLKLLDGNPDKIVSMELMFSRKARISSRCCETSEEGIMLDRLSEKVDVYRRMFNGSEVRGSYHIENGVTAFLDGVPVDIFSHVTGNPADAVENGNDTRHYLFRVKMKHGVEREVKGTFDRYGLPDDWADFADMLSRFLYYYGVMGQMLNPFMYGKTLRRKDELVFCNVRFKDGGKTYCYLADEDIYHSGEEVVVPVTRRDGYGETVGIVDSVEYHTKEDAPYPVDRIKHIIGKH